MKKLLLVFVLLLIIPLSSAFNFEDTESNLGTFKQGDCVNLYQSCSNCSYVNISGVIFPNSSLNNINLVMEENDYSYNYSYCNASSVGSYFYIVCGNQNEILDCEKISFKITYTGTEFSTPKGMIYLGLLGVLIFFFIVNVWVIRLLPSSNTKDTAGELISINKLKHLRTILWLGVWILLMSIMFISSNIAIAYLEVDMLSEFFFMIYKVMMLMTLPMVVILFLYMFTRVFQDINLEKMIQRGFESTP